MYIYIYVYIVLEIYVYIHEHKHIYVYIYISQRSPETDGLGEAGKLQRPGRTPGEPGGPSWRARIMHCVQSIHEKAAQGGPWRPRKLPGDTPGIPGGCPREPGGGPGSSRGDPWGPRQSTGDPQGVAERFQGPGGSPEVIFVYASGSFFPTTKH